MCGMWGLLQEGLLWAALDHHAELRLVWLLQGGVTCTVGMI